MFSSEACVHYNLNPLGEVICQFRFPEILTISANLPVEYQEAIRGDYPQYLKKQDVVPPKVVNSGGSFTLQNSAPVINYQFASPDGIWRVNLTGRFISLSCSHYTNWEAFAAHLDKPLAEFIRIYRPAYFERIGLRYLNFISREKLGLTGIPFSQLIAPCYLGPLAEEDVIETNTTRCTVDTEMAIRGGCRLKLHAGPGLVSQGGTQDKEVKFVFDQDLYMNGQLPAALCAGALQTLHAQANAVFRGAITDRLHDAMEPVI